MASPGMLRPSVIKQNFPGKPQFTEEDIPDLGDRVYIVTGSSSGVGKELAQILYAANARVYLACRTESKARKAMGEIQAAVPQSAGRLVFLPLDLADMTTIKPSVEAFCAQEQRLDVLFNNAGVMVPPVGSKTAQGYELQLGTNCLGPLLLTELLTPVLKQTAASQPAGTVRVVWVASMAAELYSVKQGVDMKNLGPSGYIKEPGPSVLYGNSKAGMYLYSAEYARQHREDQIVSVAINPGNLDTELYRSVDQHGFFLRTGLTMFTKLMLHPQKYGAYTELFAGLSSSVTMEKTGGWIGPWGRFFDMRRDIETAAKPVSEGGLDIAKQFWDWSQEQIKLYE